MKQKSKLIGLGIFAVWIIIAAIGAFAIKWTPATTDETNYVHLFGLNVGSGVMLGFVFVVAILIAAVCVRLFAIPNFKNTPGQFQAFVEGIAHKRKRKPKKPSLMSKKTRITATIVLAAWIIITLIGTIVVKGLPKHETLAEAMRDAVMHEENKVMFFGMIVNPSVKAGFIVVITLLIVALLIRIFVIPRFSNKPGKVQIVLEMMVSFFADQAHTEKKKLNKFLGAYMMAAGVFIFFSTLSELIGVQLVTVEGASISMPAPISDINCAICLGCLSYLIIMASGIVGNGFKGILYTLKEFSLPISMSFRLFGALLSGLLVTDLVYFVIQLSYVLPVIVGIMFTSIHAIMQTYILCMLISMYSAEVSEKHPKKVKVKKQKKNKKNKIQAPAGAEG